MNFEKGKKHTQDYYGLDHEIDSLPASGEFCGLMHRFTSKIFRVKF